MVAVRADEIAYALSKRHKEDVFLTEIKNGPTWGASNLCKFDAMAMKRSWTKPCITIYEIKVSRSDFMRDEKYVLYLKFCHRFYWVCPTGLIQKEEVGKDIGLVWYKPETGTLLTRKKALYRMMENDPVSMLYHIIFSRLSSDSHPFFSDKRDFLKAWVANKKDNKELGGAVGSKMAGEISRLTRETERMESAAEELKTLQGILEKYDLYRWHYGFEEELARRLETGTPKGLLRTANELVNKAVALRDSINGSGSA